MANRKISDLTALTATATGDLLPIVDISEAGAADQNKKITIENLFKGIPGNVGIGTASPGATLDVTGNTVLSGTSGFKYLYFNGSTDSISIRFAKIGKNYDSTFDLGIWASTHTGGNSAATVFYRDITNESARIDSSGRLLVGTSTGEYLITTNTITYNAGKIGILTIGRSGAEYPSAGYNVRYGSSVDVYTYDTTDSAAMIKYGQNGGRIETFTAATGTAGNAISFTTGPYVAQGGTSWTSSSDERLKEDLVPIEDALEKTSTLRAVTGRFKTDAPDKRRSFLLAQDVRVVLPEAVDETIPDSLGLDYSGLIPLLVAALKESKERIETLEARLTAAGIA